MKLGLVFAIAAIGAFAAGAAGAAEPTSVVGIWNAQKLDGVLGMPALQFTSDGQVFSVPRFSVVQRFVPPATPAGQAPALPPPPRAIIGRYEVRDDKVVVRLDSRASTTFELTNDGRLCVFPGPGMLNGVFKPSGGARQCYERVTVKRS